MKEKIVQTILQYKQEWLVFGLLFILYAAFIPVEGHEFDLWCWSKWAKHHFIHGLQYAYRSDTDYLPVYHYVLYLYSLTQGVATNDIYDNVQVLQTWTLIFDFLGVFLVLKMISEQHKDYFKDYFFFGLVMLLNIAYTYNTIIWGQVDAIVSFLILLMLYFALKEKIIGSLIVFIITLNFKLQAIVFIPLLGLVLLPALVKQFSVINLGKWLLAIVLPLILIIFPFWSVGDLDKIWQIATQSVGKYPKLSLHACNVWYLLFEGNPTKMLDSELFLGITYRKWGIGSFFLLSFFALFPLLKRVYEIIITKTKQHIPVNMVMLVGALITIIFFFVNTQMHERYTHPAFLFIMVFAFSTKKWWFYILFSFAYVLNLEKVLHFFNLKWYDLFFFQEEFIATLYLIIIVGLFWELYKGKNTSASGLK